MVKQRVIAMLPRILVIVAVVVILGAAAGGGSALAAKGGIKGKPGGNGNGGNGDNGATATLAVSPNPVPAYGFFHAQGCGYVVGKVVNVYLLDGKTTRFGAVAVDANGCISFDWDTGAPATYKLEASQNLKGKTQTLMASTTFEVR